MVTVRKFMAVINQIESILQDTQAFSGYINKTRLHPGLNDDALHMY